MIPPLFCKQEVEIWRVKKCFPRYGVPIWSLWPNIRFLPSIVAEKNVTKNEHICSMCIKINKVGKQEVEIWWVLKRFPRYGVPIWSLSPNIRFVSSIVAEKNATKNVHICTMCIKTNEVRKQEVGIWRVQKRYPQYGIPIWSLGPNIRFLPLIVAEKNATKNILDGQTDRGKTVYPPPPPGSGGIINQSNWTHSQDLIRIWNYKIVSNNTRRHHDWLHGSYILTNYAISDYHDYVESLNPTHGEVYWIQHYVIKLANI